MYEITYVYMILTFFFNFFFKVIFLIHKINHFNLAIYFQIDFLKIYIINLHSINIIISNCINLFY